jgi:SAM-dependent methyltransferase
MQAEQLKGLLRPDWAGPAPVDVGGVWSFLRPEPPKSGDPLALARWMYRHADELKPLCGQAGPSSTVQSRSRLMEGLPASPEEVGKLLSVAQFGQVLNDLGPISRSAPAQEYPTLSFFRSALEPAHRATLLDLGCSAGRQLRDAGEIIPARLVGVDLDVLAMQLGAQAFEAAGRVPPTWVCADITNLPFASGAFSHVISACVLTQVPIRRALAEAWRVLRPGGQLALTVEGPGLWRLLWDEAKGWGTRIQLMRWRLANFLFEVGLDWQAHPWTARLAGLTPMGPGLITRLVREAGFEVTGCRTVTEYQGQPRVVGVVARKLAGGRV